MNNPYGQLHIYYLEGCLKTDSPFSGDDFIGNWEEDGHSFLFFLKPVRHQIDRLLRAQPQLKFLDEFRMSYEEWLGGPVKPQKIGRLLISPPWSPAAASAGDDTIHVLLDPGVVFGNGAHPTTRHCIEALEILYAKDRPATIVDLGTGTGLLSLAAVKLGGSRALAVDLNLLAVRTAQKNIRHNRLSKQILAIQGRAENFVDLSSDLVISNIHYDVMKHLIGTKGFLSEKYFILSGLLRSQATQVERVIHQCPVKIIQRWEHEGVWFSYLGKADTI